ncbi:hypothetical protein [Bacillus sp. OK048]|uniref:hypothetical protein n=1 Tax=Bacillus sp. OK048 TaxID=1882761 RepID=UPI00111365EF|nr:hypothetical protein [Bacillus sp. OK048]
MSSHPFGAVFSPIDIQSIFAVLTEKSSFRRPVDPNYATMIHSRLINDDQSSWENRKNRHHNPDEDHNSWRNHENGHHTIDDDHNSWRNHENGHLMTFETA